MRSSNPAVGIALALALALGACGGGGSPAPGSVAVAPAPTPAPSPSPTPTPAPLTASQALKAALAGGAPRQVSNNGTTVSVASASAYANAVTVRYDDARLRLLGGVWRPGVGSPADGAAYMQSITRGDPTLLAANGLPASRYGLNGGVEFVLPAGQSDFELAFLDAGSRDSLQVEIDRVAVNDAGFDLSIANSGAVRFARVQLPASSSARTIRLTFGQKPLVGLRLPAGGSLASLPASRVATMVFEGDSITEGAFSTHSSLSWPVLTAQRLGVANPIVVGIGGTGYLARRTGGGYVFRERIANVTQALGGGPPDAVVVAGGFNDCGVMDPTPFPIAQVGDEALAYFQALRAAAPQMVIFVLGPFSDYNHVIYSPTSTACRDAIFASARQVSGTYTIDVSDWITTANRDTLFDLSRDGNHPTDAGHAVYAQRAAAAIGSIISGF